MESTGQILAVAVLVAGFGVFIWCTICVYRNYRRLRDEPDIARSSMGWEMRQLFHLLLCASLAARVLSLFAELAFEPQKACVDTRSKSLIYGPLSSGNDQGMKNAAGVCWLLEVIYQGPILLFFTTYSLFSFFLAKLYYRMKNVPNFPSTYMVLVVNCVIYGLYFVSLVVGLWKTEFEVLRVGGSIISSVSSFLLFLVTAWYGIKLISQLRRESTVPQILARRRIVLWRTRLQVIICSFVLLLRSIDFALDLVIFRSSEAKTPDAALVVKSLRSVLLELIPAASILSLAAQNTSMQTRGKASGSHSGNGDHIHRVLHVDTVETYGQSQTLPFIRGDDERLEAPLLHAGHES